MKWNVALKGLAILLLTLSTLQATTFIPLPIEDQIEASDSVVWATNLGKAYKRLPNGDIVTEYKFELNLASGLPEHKVVSPNSFKVLAPGGLWQGRYYQVHGVPSFKEGEEALLFLKHSDHGWFVNNLAMGKFEILKDVQGTWFKNTIFPTHPKLGLISMEKMNFLLEKRFSTPLVPIDADKYVHREDVEALTKNSRQPASAEEVESVSERTTEKNYGLLWMMLLLGTLGFLYRIRANKAGAKKS